MPKDLYKGSRQIDDQNPQVAIAPAAPPEDPKSKRGAKSKGKSVPGAAAPAAEPGAAADPDAAPVDEGGTAAAPPAPKPKKDRAQAHHRPAGGSAGRPVDVACAGPATIRRTVPGPDAERHFHALSFSFS